MDTFFCVRVQFVRFHHNWMRSGRNSTEGTDFVNFVPREPLSTPISTLGRFFLFLLYSMKCGTEDQDIAIFSYISKIVPCGAGYDPDDGNIGQSKRD